MWDSLCNYRLFELGRLGVVVVVVVVVEEGKEWAILT
jgi:hypothetical protein